MASAFVGLGVVAVIVAESGAWSIVIAGEVVVELAGFPAKSRASDLGLRAMASVPSPVMPVRSTV